MPRKVGSVGSISGDKKGIIILVNFTDKSFAASQSDFYNLANTVNYNSGNYKGSMYDYFYAQSEGQFRLTFDVVGPYTLSHNCAYYGGNDSSGDDLRPGNMVKEAVQLANADVNFANYDWDNDGYVDQVYVVYAGKGEADGGDDDTIWPHEWELSSATGSYITLDGKKINTYACGGEQNGGTGATAGIGTMCHEFSHCLGYPDFYDTDYSGGQGMFEWDLMDSGSYNDDGYRPAGYTSYERWVAGWKEPVELKTTQNIADMAPLQNTGSNTYIIYNNGNSDEYFLLENRQKVGWDAALPGAGLLILHVDYSSSAWENNQPNDDPSHQRMTWIPADNQYQYTIYQETKYYTEAGAKNDPFPYGNVNAFNKNTTPAAKFYNKNSDNTYYLDSSVENITQNSNGTISFNFVGISNVATPTFSPAAGKYADAQTVSISCETAGATIYYTIDGSTPTTSSSVYSSPLTVSETMTIKAFAVKAGDQSAVATAKYTIGSGSSSDPNTNKFKRVTAVSELEDGMRYIIACGSKTTAAGSLNSSYLNKEDVTLSNDIITIGDGVAVFVLEGDQTNGWTFKNEGTNQYLRCTAAKNVSYSSSEYAWTLSDGSEGVIMEAGEYGTMLYNNGSPRFTTYTSTPTATMIQANLYMEYSDGTTPVTPEPIIVADESLNFSTTVGTPQVKSFEVLSEGLTEDITATLTDQNNVFSLSTSTIGRAASEDGVSVDVTFTPATAGNYTGTVTLTSTGADPVTISLTATATENTTPVDPSPSGNEYALITSASDFTEGDYIIVYDGVAMNTTITNNRLQYTDVTPSNDVITTTDAAIIWHIAPSGNYYTIYNAGENKYVASTGTKSQAQLLTSGTDDKSLWSVTTGSTFEFVNKNNTSAGVNANLRRNGSYGFACYATGTGGALSLYKRTSGSSVNPTNAYYQPADGKKGAALKTSMCGIIYDRTEQTYNSLWTAFNTTDVRDGNKVWDMYSNITNYELGGSAQGASTTEEGVSYNREHSFPKSWFGGEVMPMYTDLHHIYPVDGYINQRRSNNPFGETSGNNYMSANDFSKLGTCTYSGYTGKVFEPADEYKGDFARTYFYMVTCYEEKLNDWYTNYGVNNTDSGASETRNAVMATLNGSTYPGFQAWQLEMLMEWAKNDPVSEKETNRNNAVYGIQGNRNPFIDYPGLQEYIWGFMTDVSFSYDNYQQPVYKQDVTMTFNPSSATATLGEDFTEPTLTTDPAGLTVTYSSSNTSVATVDASGEVALVAAGTTTITATFAGNDMYNGGTASYTLTVSSSSTPVVGSGNYALVTDASTLAAGDKILIAYVDGDSRYALSTTQNTNNRAATTNVTLNNDDTLTPGNDAQVITIEKDGTNFLFNVGNGYLYAASSGSNQLKTETTADANAKAAISIISNNATITFQGTNSRNIMRFNPNSGNPIFSCYGSTSTAGSLPQIYRETQAQQAKDDSDLTITSSSSLTLDAQQTSTITWTTSSTGAMSFVSSDTDVATVTDAGVVTAVGAGSATITITQAADDTYNASGEKTVDVTVNGVNSITLSETSKTAAYADGAFSLTATVPTTNYDGTLTAASSNEYVATVAVEGTTIIVTPQAVGSATITVTAGAGTYYPATAQAECEVTVTMPEGSTTAPSSGADYTKITSANDLLDGEYLIVYEGDGTHDALAFDGSRSSLDAINNTIGVTILNNTIASTADADAAVFTISAVSDGYSIKSASNLYIGQASDANAMTASESVLTNAISFDTSGNVNIVGTGGAHLRYNYASNQNRFRYYKSSTYSAQQPIALYKRAASTATETVTINKYGYATYCSALPIDYSSTEGYTAWCISSIADDGTITFEKITEQIKGGQGVLLYNKDADGVNTSTATITFADGDTEFSDAQNRFVGTTAPTYVASETAYGLSTNKFVKNNVAGVIPAGKAYIPAAEIPNNVRAFTFVFSDPITGISETQTVSPEEFGAMFNLAGQRISQPQKGVIIVNGKKILVR